ncbi:MAG: glycosyltransferase family 1 protein [Anaerolineales bacterium]|nr:glycosyltransferase family 1 protein [Anaerolineales bacterium]
MRITIVTLGTRGDVQPYVALALGLKNAGHHVRLATHALFRNFVTGYGIDFAALPIDPQDLLAAEEDPQWINPIGNTVRNIHKTVKTVSPFVHELLRDCVNACADADVVLSSTLGALAGYHVAEKLEVPFYPAYIQNIIRTGAYPSVLAPVLPLGSVYNRLSYSLGDRLAWQAIRPAINVLRREALGLPGLPLQFPLERVWQARQPHLLGFSPAVLPKPPEWGDWVHVTGYWFLPRPADWRPPAGLVDFLGAGPAPVSVGFGSITIGDPEAATALVLEALARSKQRGLLLTGWGGLRQSDLPDHVFKLEAVPHDWLFPRMAAVVHHGGAGTTAAGLRAGVPNIVIPNFMDQPFWGHQVARLGAGPSPIPRNQLTARRLASAIQAAVGDPVLRSRAAAIGRQLQAEDGVACAVEAFQRHPAWVLTNRPAAYHPVPGWAGKLRAR